MCDNQRERQISPSRLTPTATKEESMPDRSQLSPVAQAVVEQEAKRIAELGDAWQPTPENLCEVVKRVLEAEAAKRSQKQREVMNRAREAGSPIGRPTLDIPPAFEKLYRQCQAGELFVDEVLQKLHISRNTYYKWVQILRDEGKDVPREKRKRRPRGKRA